MEAHRVTATQLVTHFVDHQFDVVIRDGDVILAVLTGEEDQSVQCHLKLWTGADEGATDRFGVALPSKLDANQLGMTVRSRTPRFLEEKTKTMTRDR